jgi:hypothetical protein
MAHVRVRSQISRRPSGLLVGGVLAGALSGAVAVGELVIRTRWRDREARLAREQVALGQVATIVAQAVPLSVVFEADAREVGLICDADLVRVGPDGTVTVLAGWSGVPVEVTVVAARVRAGAALVEQVRRLRHVVGKHTRTRSAVSPRESVEWAALSLVDRPIVVAGRRWGQIAVWLGSESPFLPDVEPRIGQFAELAAHRDRQQGKSR